MRPEGWRFLYGARILVSPDEQILSTIIATPDHVSGPKPESGVIVDLGHGLDGSEFEIGDHIAFRSHSGTTVTLKDQKLLMITPSEVMALLEEADATAV